MTRTSTTDTAANAPVDTLRDGRLKATVWENHGESGAYHTVTLAKVYEDRDGNLQETGSFSAGELLRVAELAREAHAMIRNLRRERAPERRPEARPEGRSAERPAARSAPVSRATEERPRRFEGMPRPGLER